MGREKCSVLGSNSLVVGCVRSLIDHGAPATGQVLWQTWRCIGSEKTKPNTWNCSWRTFSPVGKRGINARITFTNVRLPFNKSVNGSQRLRYEVEEGMIAQKVKDAFIRQRGGSLGYSSR